MSTAVALAVVALTHEIETASSADPDAGAPMPGLTNTEEAFFTIGRDEFNAVEAVKEGLGPTMNLDSCGGCHSQPATGGTSPALNPQIVFASQLGARTADGGVHSLFTIAGRSDAPGCSLAQPDFENEDLLNFLRSL
jgi:hypothetical protein